MGCGLRDIYVSDVYGEKTTKEFHSVFTSEWRNFFIERLSTGPRGTLTRSDSWTSFISDLYPRGPSDRPRAHRPQVQGCGPTTKNGKEPTSTLTNKQIWSESWRTFLFCCTNEQTRNLQEGLKTRTGNRVSALPTPFKATLKPFKALLRYPTQTIQPQREPKLGKPYRTPSPRNGNYRYPQQSDTERKSVSYGLREPFRKRSRDCLHFIRNRYNTRVDLWTFHESYLFSARSTLWSNYSWGRGCYRRTEAELRTVVHFPHTGTLDPSSSGTLWVPNSGHQWTGNHLMDWKSKV